MSETKYHNVVREFDNWADYIAASQLPRVEEWKHGTSHRPGSELKGNKYYPGGSKWHGTETWEEAIDYALNGWKAGRKRLYNAIVQVMPQREVIRAFGRDVAGEYPIVPLAVAGDIMSMVAPRKTMRRGSPVIRIDYGSNVHAKISPLAVLNRGAALLSLVDRIEQRGYSTELRIAMQCCSGFTGDRQNTFTMIVTFKRAGDPLDLDRAAFAMTNPAVQRRLRFALQEQHPELADSMAHNYGGTLYEPLPDSDENTIYVSGATDDDMEPERARQRMEKLFADVLERALSLNRAVGRS